MLKTYPTKPCRYCGSSSHFPYQCYKNPRRKNKPISKSGKVTKQWLVTRKQWFKQNPPEPEPYPHYVCYICGIWLLPPETTLDHVLSRSHHPELRFILANLKPCCGDCNREKGSKDGNLWSII